MTIAEAFAAWKSGIEPGVIAQYGADDIPALSESWNDYTDMLCKDGELSDLQYHHCPAFDDKMPSDAEYERAYILGAMGVVMESTRVSVRPDAGDWSDGSRHFEFVVSRGSRSHKGFYSMGSALTGSPDLCDLMNSLLMDTSDIEQDFEDWASDLGYDPDSRKAKAIYSACKAALASLERMFTDQELDDLRELFSDY